MLLDFEKLNIKNVTSKVLLDYYHIKTKNLDSILLYQIGDFYETFFQDAKIISDVTGIVLGTRKIKGTGEIPQAGVPIDKLNFYVKQLLNKNYKVSLCEQFLDEKNKFSRRIVRKFTKGTIIENELLESGENNFILSLYKIKPNLYKLSYADASTGQFYKADVADYQLKLEIEKIDPKETIISINQKKDFEDFVQNVYTNYIDDKFFENKQPEKAIVNYCAYTLQKYQAKLDKIIEYTPNSFLAMDEVTRNNLEISRTRRFFKKTGSIIWFINYSKTPMGVRLLKKYLSEPLVNTVKIDERLDTLEELKQDKTKLKKLHSILEEFCDLSRICAKISNATINPKDLFQIVKNAKTIKELIYLTETYNSNLLHLNKEKSKEVLDLSDRIENGLLETPNTEIKSGNIIKEGYNSNLDYLRGKLENIKIEIQNYEQEQKQKLNFEKLKVGYSNIINYYIELPSSKQNLAPKDYIRKQSLTHCTRYTTEFLKKLEEESLSLKFKINELEYELYCQIRLMASDFVETIRDLAKDIARIDVMASYAICALKNNLTRPTNSDKGIFIIDGFHPSLVKLNNEVTKNMTSLENEHMQILTGANMSGKSTYLKHNAIICLLYQIGSFVPAENAKLPIIDKIFFRQCSTDDIINNNSTFMVEMNDLKYITDNATKASLVLLDEPAKSTSSKEGGIIAKAFLEYLIKHIKAKTIVATHNSELTKLEREYPSIVTNYTIGEYDLDGNIKNRKLKQGVLTNSLALNVAILANLPDEIIENAKKYLDKKST